MDKGKAKGKKYKFIDLFAGIGGFHLAFHNVGAECVWVSEWDDPARKTYEANFKKISPKVFKNGNFAGDITKIDPETIPDFDILTGGFPCQPFSQAGKKKGFNETRGTLFFNIAEILRIKKPKAFFIENVRNLKSHDGGNTFRVMEKIIKDLGYSFNYQIIKASDYGLPTHRPRLYMVGFRDKNIEFKFPDPSKLKITLPEIFNGECDKKIGYTLRVGGKASGLNDRHNWDTYLVDGKPHRITVEEAQKMMGFPDDFVFPVTKNQAMKQLGNSVAVDAIRATAKEIVKTLKKYDK
ncbi:MAG: DNA cytosine methyltransferase [Candidatus Shapirobacteria bacterium]